MPTYTWCSLHSRLLGMGMEATSGVKATKAFEVPYFSAYSSVNCE